MACQCHPKMMVCPNNPHQYWDVAHDGTSIQCNHYSPTAQPNVFIRIHLNNLDDNEDLLGRDIFQTEKEALQIALKRLDSTIADREKKLADLKNLRDGYQQKLAQ